MMEQFVKQYGSRILIVITLILSACGSDGGLGGPAVDTSNNLSEGQALAFAKSVTRVSTSSMGAPALKANAASGETTQLRAAINQQIAYTLNCSSGGYMKASGNISGSISDQGTGMILMDIPITISNWQCLPPSVINGDPYISITGTFSFLNGYPSTQQHIQISGGFKSSDWACQINLGTNFNPSGGGHTSGTVCGYSVDFTF